MKSFESLLDVSNSVGRLGLIVERGDLRVNANVPHVVYHSPTGFDFGYSGAGPSELALSTLCALIPPPSEKEEDRLYGLPIEQYDVADANDILWSVRTPTQMRISRLAWKLHHPFKNTFIAPMKEEYGHVPLLIMRSWIEVQAKALLNQSLD